MSERPSTIHAYDLPTDKLFMQAKMLIRHGTDIVGMRLKWNEEPQSAVVQAAVQGLDDWGCLWGCVRHGPLAYETYDMGRRFALVSHFKIVDLVRHIQQTRKDEAEKEYARLRRLPWWRRLFLPRERP